MSKFSWVVAAVAAVGMGIGSSARATLIWDGDASKGTSVFKVLNIEDSGKNNVGNPSPNGSSVTVVTDSTYGKVWKFDKAAGDLRCEAHGASGFTPVVGGNYYIGWRSKVTYTGTVNAFFQWKAYGSPMVQNFPLVLKTVNGPLQLHYYPPNSGDTVLWSHNISTNTWYSHVIHIYVSDVDGQGYVEYYFGTGIENLIPGGTRYYGKTFDGSSVDPKWGVYGATSTHVTNYVGQLKIGTTYNDVAP
jgi:hypothetical protein